MNRHMLHHLSFPVSNLADSSRFYDRILRPLGFVRVWTAEDAIGYGEEGGGDKFALKMVGAGVLAPERGFHVAFSASDQHAVDEFHRLGVANGGVCNGPPGLRPHYGPSYYAAFLKDPDGFHVEAVFK